MPIRAIETPLGQVALTEEDGALTDLTWGADGVDDTPLLMEAERQLTAYFSHDLKDFDLPLRPRGDTFQQKVCAAMRAIPYGETREYGEIARDLGSMPQPVGNACGGNSIAIIIP
ncbi:MAG: MGMT family protein, partial [Pseudomonadota bacterium]